MRACRVHDYAQWAVNHDDLGGIDDMTESIIPADTDSRILVHLASVDRATSHQIADAVMTRHATPPEWWQVCGRIDHLVHVGKVIEVATVGGHLYHVPQERLL